MYYLTAEAAFDAAHFLSGYEGKCSRLHGHRWRVLLKIKADSLQDGGHERGMVTDFGGIKAALRAEMEYFDHTFIFEKNSLKETTRSALESEGFLLREVDFRPTAESFAQYFFEKFKSQGFQVSAITVYETPNNCASYCEGP